MTTIEQLSALSQILAQGNLHSLFQPIVSLSERCILGYEALTRFRDKDPSRAGSVMMSIAAPISDAQINGLATYLQTLR